MLFFCFPASKLIYVKYTSYIIGKISILVSILQILIYNVCNMYNKSSGKLVLLLLNTHIV